MSNPALLEFAFCGVDKSASLEEWSQAVAPPDGSAGDLVRFVAAFNLAYQGFPWQPTPEYVEGAPDEGRRYGGLAYPAWYEIKNYVDELGKSGTAFSFHLNETAKCPYVSGLLQGKPEYYELVKYLVEVHRARHIQVNLTAHGVNTDLFDCTSDSEELKTSIATIRKIAADFPGTLFIVPIAEIKKKDKDGTVTAKISTMPFFQRLLAAEGPVPENICGFFDSSAGTGKEPDAAPEVPPGYPSGEQYFLGFTGGINSENVKMWLDRYSERARGNRCRLICDAQSGFRQERNRSKPVDVPALLKLSQGVREWAEGEVLASAALRAPDPPTCKAELEDVKNNDEAARPRQSLAREALVGA